ncbi:MAG TPA: ATP-binding protein [Burkholderiales bacterium]
MSLRRRLLVALLSAVLLAGALASAATYWSARSQIQVLLDEELRQVALSLRDHAALDLGRLGFFYAEGGPQVAVQIWDRYGMVVYLANASTPLPRAGAQGFSTIAHDGRQWRMFTLRAGAQTIQAAQSTEERNARAAAAALRIFVPVASTLPLLALLVWLILERGFAPLARLAGAVRTRDAGALEPLPRERVPQEIEPLVSSLNSLLARLREAFGAQQRFAADAAHELRTPLTALGLQIQLLERAHSDEERRLALARLKERVQRATRVVQQLLAMARLEPEAAQPPQRFALEDVARAAVSEMAAVAGQRSVSLLVARAEPVEVTGAEDALRLLAANLVDNAIRYTSTGGRVEVGVWREGGTAILQVCDDGPGIPAGERSRVFDRFYRGAGAEGSGSGLGLAIARRVAELHGGRIDLADGLDGRGLCARLVLPQPLRQG